MKQFVGILLFALSCLGVSANTKPNEIGSYNPFSDLNSATSLSDLENRIEELKEADSGKIEVCNLLLRFINSYRNESAEIIKKYHESLAKDSGGAIEAKKMINPEVDVFAIAGEILLNKGLQARDAERLASVDSDKIDDVIKKIIKILNPDSKNGLIEAGQIKSKWSNYIKKGESKYDPNIRKSFRGVSGEAVNVNDLIGTLLFIQEELKSKFRGKTPPVEIKISSFKGGFESIIKDEESYFNHWLTVGYAKNLDSPTYVRSSRLLLDRFGFMPKRAETGNIYKKKTRERDGEGYVDFSIDFNNKNEFWAEVEKGVLNSNYYLPSIFNSVREHYNLNQVGQPLQLDQFYYFKNGQVSSSDPKMNIALGVYAVQALTRQGTAASEKDHYFVENALANIDKLNTNRANKIKILGFFEQGWISIPDSRLASGIQRLKSKMEDEALFSIVYDSLLDRTLEEYKRIVSVLPDPERVEYRFNELEEPVEIRLPYVEHDLRLRAINGLNYYGDARRSSTFQVGLSPRDLAKLINGLLYQYYVLSGINDKVKILKDLEFLCSVNYIKHNQRSSPSLDPILDSLILEANKLGKTIGSSTFQFPVHVSSTSNAMSVLDLLLTENWKWDHVEVYRRIAQGAELITHQEARLRKELFKVSVSRLVSFGDTLSFRDYDKAYIIISLLGGSNPVGLDREMVDSWREWTDPTSVLALLNGRRQDTPSLSALTIASEWVDNLGGTPPKITFGKHPGFVSSVVFEGQMKTWNADINVVQTPFSGIASQINLARASDREFPNNVDRSGELIQKVLEYSSNSGAEILDVESAGEFRDKYVNNLAIGGIGGSGPLTVFLHNALSYRMEDYESMVDHLVVEPESSAINRIGWMFQAIGRSSVDRRDKLKALEIADITNLDFVGWKKKYGINGSYLEAFVGMEDFRRAAEQYCIIALERLKRNKDIIDGQSLRKGVQNIYDSPRSYGFEGPVGFPPEINLGMAALYESENNWSKAYESLLIHKSQVEVNSNIPIEWERLYRSFLNSTDELVGAKLESKKLYLAVSEWIKKVQLDSEMHGNWVEIFRTTHEGDEGYSWGDFQPILKGSDPQDVVMKIGSRVPSSIERPDRTSTDLDEIKTSLVLSHVAFSLRHYGARDRTFFWTNFRPLEGWDSFAIAGVMRATPRTLKIDDLPDYDWAEKIFKELRELRTLEQAKGSELIESAKTAMKNKREDGVSIHHDEWRTYSRILLLVPFLWLPNSNDGQDAASEVWAEIVRTPELFGTIEFGAALELLRIDYIK